MMTIHEGELEELAREIHSTLALNPAETVAEMKGRSLERATLALRAFADLPEGEAEDEVDEELLETAIKDMVTDLIHLADKFDLSFDEIVIRAQEMAAIERKEWSQ